MDTRVRYLVCDHDNPYMDRRSFLHPSPPMLSLPMRHPPSSPFAFDTLTGMISLMLHFK